MAFKYERLMDWMKQQIADGALTAGQKLPTEAALMEQFGVSRHTVRQAISHMEEEKLVYSIQGSGTYLSKELDQQDGATGPHRTAAAPGSNIIGILMTDSTNYIFPEIIQGASEYLMSQGYLLNVSFTGGRAYREQEVLRQLQAAGIAGILVEPLTFGAASAGAELYQEIASQIPMLMLHTERSPVCPALSLRDQDGGRLIAEHLVEMGHRKIGAIYAFDEVTATPRYEGFLQVLHERGISHNEDNDIWVKRSHLNDLFQPEGSLPLDRMLGEVTAIICHDDRVAYALIMHLRARGIRVPEDVSVVGYDDSMYATLDAKITSVVHPKKKYGRRAAQAMLEMIQHPQSFDINKYIREPKLVVRETVKRLPETE